MRRIQTLAGVVALLPALAGADPLFGKGMLGDREMPKAFGIGVDYFSMEQQLIIDRLDVQFPPGFPPLPLNNVAAIRTDSHNDSINLKVDAWILPFINVFALYGELDGRTNVDLSRTGLPLPPALSALDIRYDGDVFGGGVVLAAGGDEWFASLTATITDTDLSGGFSSSVSATTMQPRFGYRYDNRFNFWIGGYFIDAEEKHAGSVNVDFGPGVGVVPIGFDVSLSPKDDFSPAVGANVAFGNFAASVEVGGGASRRTTLANLTWRFE